MGQGETFDFVIVGGGPAGCVLANRLSEDPSVSILLLEAGVSDESALIRTPAAVGRVWNHPRFNWSLHTEPEPFADGRRIFQPRGKVLGGCSSINMMSYVRGHRADFDRWRAMGATGWNYDAILPYFRRAENYDEPGPYRGQGGPLQVTKSESPDEIYDAFLQAGHELGYPFQDDYNGPEQDGFARMQLMARGGRRSSAAAAYLRPAHNRPNLVIRTEATASRLRFEGRRASGVAYRLGGEARQAHARREVILSSGAFGSPKLLMLSGIGRGADLQANGINVRADLPGVGENLRDHPQVNLFFARKGRSRIRRELRWDRLLVSVLRNELRGTGFASEAPGGVTAFVRSRRELPIPDLELFCIPSSLAARPWFPVVRPAVPDQIVIKPALLRPLSTGYVKLASADPATPPFIRANFLEHPEDRAALREGVRICRALAHSEAFRPYVGDDVAPTRNIVTDDEIDAFVRATMESIFHPCGTCRMGTDENAVVGPDLRVRGIEGLRVVDASVMPDNIGATINAAVVAIAERASDIIRGRIVP